MSTILIIPTNRDIRIGYLRPWIDQVDMFLVIDDADRGLEVLYPRAEVFDYARQKDYVGEKLWPWVPHQSFATSQFGSYFAYKEGFETAIFTCDDCLVLRDSYKEFSKLGAYHSALQSITPLNGEWYDPIPHAEVWTRGFPYRHRSLKKPLFKMVETEGKLVALMGLWNGILDINGIDKMAGADYKMKFPFHSLKAINAKFPFSGMVAAFAREALPAYIWAPARQIMPHFRLSRHEDIWAGYVLQRIAEQKGDLIGVVGPLIEHLKQGDLEKEVVAEFFEELMSDTFLTLLGEVYLGASDTYISALRKVGVHFWSQAAQMNNNAYAEYLRYYGRYITIWADAYGEI